MNKYFAISLLIFTFTADAKESLSGLNLDSSRSVLELVSLDGLGPVTFTELKNDIGKGMEYKQSVPYKVTASK